VSAPQANLLAPGQLIANKYRVARRIGAGGMGVVYAAEHVLLRERVAIKVLRAEVISDRDVVARFLNEARSAARIRSAHVAEVKDVDTLPDGTPYLVMEYLEGCDLGHRHRDGDLVAVIVAVDYVMQTLEALAEAHAAGLVHRDLKPANLFLAKQRDGSETLKVLDFGIAKSADLEVVTHTGTVLGSPSYMAPEQIRNARGVDARADIWSVGIILYKLLAGRKPFDGQTIGETFAAIFAQEAAPLRLSRPDVPEALEKLILKRCLARDPRERCFNVAVLARALVQFGGPSARASVERIERSLASGTTPSSDNDPASLVVQPATQSGTNRDGWATTQVAPASGHLTNPAPEPAAKRRVRRLDDGKALLAIVLVGVGLMAVRAAHHLTSVSVEPSVAATSESPIPLVRVTSNTPLLVTVDATPPSATVAPQATLARIPTRPAATRTQPGGIHACAAAREMATLGREKEASRLRVECIEQGGTP